MALPVSFRWDEEFVRRIDGARGLVPRSAFVRAAVERALDGPGVLEAAASPREPAGPAPAEQPEIIMTDEVKQKFHRLGIPPGIAPVSSFAKRGVGPVPKGKG